MKYDLLPNRNVPEQMRGKENPAIRSIKVERKYF